MVHGRPGPAPQTAKRERFAQLIARACRMRRRAASSASIRAPESAGDTAAQSPAAPAGGGTIRL
jgi:hypothetical protein